MSSEIPSARLRDIIANSDRIHAHMQTVAPDAKLDAKTRDAIERCLERISEAARKLGPAMDARDQSVPWRSIRGLGNILRHECDIVDDANIEQIVRHELVTLRDVCVRELAAQRPDDEHRLDL